MVTLMHEYVWQARFVPVYTVCVFVCMYVCSVCVQQARKVGFLFLMCVQ